MVGRRSKIFKIYFFNWKKSKGQEKLWDKIKCEDGTYKFISILFSMNKLSFMKTLFKTEGWDEERVYYLLSF